MQGENRRKSAVYVYVINEHYEPVFNTAAATQIVFQVTLTQYCRKY